MIIISFIGDIIPEGFKGFTYKNMKFNTEEDMLKFLKGFKNVKILKKEHRSGIVK